MDGDEGPFRHPDRSEAERRDLFSIRKVCVVRQGPSASLGATGTTGT